MVSLEKYNFRLEGSDGGCQFEAGFRFLGRAIKSYNIAVSRGWHRVKLIRVRDNKVLFSKC